MLVIFPLERLSKSSAQLGKHYELLEKAIDPRNEQVVLSDGFSRSQAEVLLQDIREALITRAQGGDNEAYKVTSSYGWWGTKRTKKR